MMGFESIFLKENNERFKGEHISIVMKEVDDELKRIEKFEDLVINIKRVINIKGNTCCDDVNMIREMLEDIVI